MRVQALIEQITSPRFQMHNARNAKQLRARHNALRQGIGHTWMEKHIHYMSYLSRSSSAENACLLNNRIDQQLPSKLVDLGGVQRARNLVKLRCAEDKRRLTGVDYTERG